jgi:short-subunit dehydrogenase involved in D-alanine esterification of teichoic acids
VRDLVSFAETTFGDLTVLINNASAPHTRGDGLENWMEAIETDLLGAIHATRYAIEAMRRHGTGGSIVNIASISALWHGPKTPEGIPGYDVAKAGMIRDDNETRLTCKDGPNSCELPRPGLDRDRGRAPALGIADPIGTSRARRALSFADARSDF